VQRFGEKLRALRKRRGMTIMELTTALGYIGYGHIHAVETGKKKPTAELVVKVARLFQVTTDQLLFDELELADNTAPGAAPDT
jgi:transcriptional regulator with XRE-family HTH domain